MNLNIIGNGFDLYHGLPSSYYYFGCYLIKTDPEFYEGIGKMYELHYMKMVGPSIAHDYEHVVEDIFWSDFESHLSRVDEYFVVESSLDDLGLEYPDPVEIELEQDKSADLIKSNFAKWVRETLDVDSNYSLIKENLVKKSWIKFNDDDYFIQFNYTHTLQELYDINDERIHYVHGECHGEDGGELIIGHGNDSRILEIKYKIEKLDKEYDYTQRNYNRRNEYRCLHNYLKKLRKEVDACKINCDYFYGCFEEDIEIVKIFGLSMWDVDLPYLNQIRERWPAAKWSFSFYNEDNIVHIEDVAKNYLNLDDDEFTVFELKNIQTNDIRKEIVQQRMIDEVEWI